MRPVHNYIKEYLHKEIYPFHMPGHKRNRVFLPPELLDMDITEIDGADNLLEPTGIILRLEERVADVFGACKSFIATNGATGGILGAVAAVNKPGKPILVARNCHKSVYSALVNCDLKPIYFFPEITDINIAGGINPEAVRETVSKNPDAAAIVLTSPTYEGFISDISAIVDVAHVYNIPVIVDEAHGAHLSFRREFADSAVKLGADIVVQSLHKQLPTLSQMAVVHVNGGLVSAELVKKSMNLFQTTSPSYMLLAQADYALSMLMENPRIMEGYLSLLTGFRNNYPREAAAELIGDEYSGCSSIYAVDIAKLLFYSSYSEYSGQTIERHFRDYGVQIEMSGPQHVVALTTCADTPEGFRRLSAAAPGFKPPKHLKPHKRKSVLPPPKPVTALSPRVAFFRGTRKVALHQAENRISANFIVPYPPGVPLVAPGEIITSEVISYINFCIANKISVTGADSVMAVDD